MTIQSDSKNIVCQITDFSDVRCIPIQNAQHQVLLNQNYVRN